MAILSTIRLLEAVFSLLSSSVFIKILLSNTVCTTGSLLVAAAYFGGFVFGVDIDYMMIHGQTKPTRKQARVSIICEKPSLSSS